MSNDDDAELTRRVTRGGVTTRTTTKGGKKSKTKKEGELTMMRTGNTQNKKGGKGGKGAKGKGGAGTSKDIMNENPKKNRRFHPPQRHGQIREGSFTPARERHSFSTGQAKPTRYSPRHS
ncbi:uncharacterized protein LOC119171444 isoform X1 [Rhipicephalus microplus]|uniref:uncharacterized protein LOC119171444 isoform X1 n=1 Tax=Rhipicephalus microplus TaxID=6941 RepID=UPI003F6CBC1E